MEGVRGAARCSAPLNKKGGELGEGGGNQEQRQGRVLRPRGGACA